MKNGLEILSTQLQEQNPNSIPESEGIAAARTLTSLFELLIEIHAEQEGKHP